MRDHFEQFRTSITIVLRTHHFEREMPGFDASLLLNEANKTHLHKYEFEVEGVHVFRALVGHKHLVYCVDKEHRLLLLRAFGHFMEYRKFLSDRKAILSSVAEASVVS